MVFNKKYIFFAILAFLVLSTNSYAETINESNFKLETNTPTLKSTPQISGNWLAWSENDYSFVKNRQSDKIWDFKRRVFLDQNFVLHEDDSLKLYVKNLLTNENIKIGAGAGSTTFFSIPHIVYYTGQNYIIYNMLSKKTKILNSTCNVYTNKINPLLIDGLLLTYCGLYDIIFRLVNCLVD